MKNSKTLLMIGCAIMLFGCGKEKKETVKLESFPVRVEAAARKPLEETLSVVGSIKAKDEAILYARVPGKLKENLLKEGDPVKKNQTVAVVERDEVGVKYEPAPVPSTLDGVVGRIYLDRGTNVTLNTPIALVVDSSELKVQADVPETYSGKVFTGQEVYVVIDNASGKKFYAKVTKVSPVVNPGTRSFLIEAAVDNRAGVLKSGMFAEVYIVTGRKTGVLALPSDALAGDGNPYIFIVKDGKAFKRDVVTGMKTKDLTEIKKGLSEGENVVIFGIYGLKDESPVEIVGDSAGAAEAVK